MAQSEQHSRSTAYLPHLSSSETDSAEHVGMCALCLSSLAAYPLQSSHSNFFSEIRALQWL